ncbi:MAG: helix-turn-helix transcriptional regulator [Bacteroidota bacterium]
MEPFRIKTVAQYHQLRGLPKPAHPLASVLRIEDVTRLNDDEPQRIVQDFYMVALKDNVNAVMNYGQREYDFKEGSMIFIAPNQLYSIRAKNKLTHRGWLLLVHPDFIWDDPLNREIKNLEYFGYSVNEALHLSQKERTTMDGIFQNILEEHLSNIDRFSRRVIISQVKTLFNYADRFYNRQFITREKENHQILTRLEKLLNTHFNDDGLRRGHPPSVTDIADSLNVSPGYLSSLLKLLTGRSTQHFIQERIVEKAKERLSFGEMSISDIAYELGFEYPQSFSKLFKSKTGQSPSEYRSSLN